MGRIRTERRPHVFVHKLLQVEPEGAQRPHHNIAAHAAIRRDIAHGIGNARIGGVVNHVMARALKCGGGEAVANAIGAGRREEKRGDDGKEGKNTGHMASLTAKSGANKAPRIRDRMCIAVCPAVAIQPPPTMEGHMKSGLLLALRASTGLLLVIWGSLRAFNPEVGVGLSNKYYSGAINAESLQAAMGWGQIALGVLVIFGLFRIIVYPLQAVILVGGALAIWKYLLDPLGLYLLTDETRNILFFPSTTVAIATLIMLAFREYDALSLDRLLKRG